MQAGLERPVAGNRVTLHRCRRKELRTAEQHALVSVRPVPATTFDRNGRAYRLSRGKAAQWLAAEIGDEQPGSPAHLPRTGPAPRTGTEAARRKDPSARTPRGLKSLADRTLVVRGAHFSPDRAGAIFDLSPDRVGRRRPGARGR